MGVFSHNSLYNGLSHTSLYNSTSCDQSDLTGVSALCRNSTHVLCCNRAVLDLFLDSCYWDIQAGFNQSISSISLHFPDCGGFAKRKQSPVWCDLPQYPWRKYCRRGHTYVGVIFESKTHILQGCQHYWLVWTNLDPQFLSNGMCPKNLRLIW